MTSCAACECTTPSILWISKAILASTSKLKVHRKQIQSQETDTNTRKSSTSSTNDLFTSYKQKHAFCSLTKIQLFITFLWKHFHNKYSRGAPFHTGFQLVFAECHTPALPSQCHGHHPKILSSHNSILQNIAEHRMQKVL